MFARSVPRGRTVVADSVAARLSGETTGSESGEVGLGAVQFTMPITLYGRLWVSNCLPN